jgi:hypothetical protein
MLQKCKTWLSFRRTAKGLIQAKIIANFRQIKNGALRSESTERLSQNGTRKINFPNCCESFLIESFFFAIQNVENGRIGRGFLGSDICLRWQDQLPSQKQVRNESDRQWRKYISDLSFLIYLAFLN